MRTVAASLAPTRLNTSPASFSGTDGSSTSPAWSITASMAFTPLVTGRVGSSARTCSASCRASREPCGVPVSMISLPIEYMITLGWLRSLAIIAARSSRHHCGKSSA